jgi:hypothetical protein
MPLEILPTSIPRELLGSSLVMSTLEPGSLSVVIHLWLPQAGPGGAW